MNITLVPVIPHKWLSSANIVARYATVFASFVWGLVILRYEVGFTSTYVPLTAVMPEDAWALLLISAAVYMLFHTRLQIKENWLTLACNAIMTGIWGYTVLSFVIYWVQLPPGGFAASLTIFLLSCMNSLAIPKRE